MPGFLLHAGATVLCMHGGQAQATAPSPRVRAGGQPVVTLQAPHVVAGCAFIPPAGNGPCTTAQWVSAATRVRASGGPVLLADSQAVCTPTGTGLIIAVTQVRVRGQ
jgi:hypothetical protein